MANKRKKLGEILIESGIVSEDQLMSALALQKKSGKMIGQTLIELGYISDSQLMEAFLKKFSISYIDCSNLTVKEEHLKIGEHGHGREEEDIPDQCVGKHSLSGYGKSS